MNELARRKYVDGLIDMKVQADFDISAMVGFRNALSALVSAYENGHVNTAYVIENALGLNSVYDLEHDYHFIPDEKMERVVADTEEFMKRHYNCDIQKIQKSEKAKKALENTKELLKEVKNGKQQENI